MEIILYFLCYNRPAYDSEIMEPLKDSIKALHAKVMYACTYVQYTPNKVGGLSQYLLVLPYYS